MFATHTQLTYEVMMHNDNNAAFQRLLEASLYQPINFLSFFLSFYKWSNNSNSHYSLLTLQFGVCEIWCTCFTAKYILNSLTIDT